MCLTIRDLDKEKGVAQMVKEKNQPAMQETWVCSMGPEDPLGKGMAMHSNTLDWEIPWTEKSGRLQSMLFSCSMLSNSL